MDDVLLNKAAAIERSIARAREEYAKGAHSFVDDHTRQDAAVLNIQRACEAAIDMGQWVLRRDYRGLPQGARETFTALADAGYISTGLADSLRRMVAYRNIAVHEYQKLLLPITVAIIERHLDDFLSLSRTLVQGTPQA